MRIAEASRETKTLVSPKRESALVSSTSSMACDTGKMTLIAYEKRVMRAISDDEYRNIVGRIVADYGNGAFDENRYIFEQLVSLPSGVEVQYMTSASFIGTIDDESVILIFDQNDNNRKWLDRLRAKLEIGDAKGVVLKSSDAIPILNQFNFDAYVTTTDGALLGVLTHENPQIANSPLIGVMVAPMKENA